MKRRELLQLALCQPVLAVLAGCEKASPTGEAASSASAAAASPQALAIATGSTAGNYYKAAGELKRALGDAVALDVRPSAGSFSNIAQLGSSKVQLAIAQFDALKVFLKLGDKRAKMAQSALVVAPLGLELVHILVNQNANIEGIADLAGKRISVGPMHSGSWISAWSIMFHMNDVNIEKADNIFKQPYEEAVDKLIKGEFDALFITTAPGMPLLDKMGAEAGMHIDLLSLGQDFSIPEGARSSYLLETIAPETYPFCKHEVRTLATPYYLLAHAQLDSAVVKRIAERIYDGTLQKSSELWKHATKKRVKQDLDNKVPYHPGVLEQLGL